MFSCQQTVAVFWEQLLLLLLETGLWEWSLALKVISCASQPSIFYSITGFRRRMKRGAAWRKLSFSTEQLFQWSFQTFSRFSSYTHQHNPVETLETMIQASLKPIHHPAPPFMNRCLTMIMNVIFVPNLRHVICIVCGSQMLKDWSVVCQQNQFKYYHWNYNKKTV